jgi:hypothetical protein
VTTFEVVTAGGEKVTVEAVSAQVDSGGWLGFFNERGWMHADFRAGTWQSYGIPPEPGPVVAAALEPPAPANDTGPAPVVLADEAIPPVTEGAAP